MAVQVKCIGNIGDKVLLPILNKLGDTVEIKYPLKTGEIYDDLIENEDEVIYLFETQGGNK